jgi:soluble lytic murein transglycosylase-like protein
MNLKLMRAEWRAVRRAALRLTHNSLSMVGLATIGAVAVFATHPQFLPQIPDSIKALVLPAAPTAIAATVPADAIAAAIVAPGGEASRILGLNESDATKLAVSNDQSSSDRIVPAPRERKEAISYLSKKYRVNGDAIGILVDAAYSTGRELNLDPLLLLSVMAVESGFNPFAESTAGASGLMQLMSKVHADKLADFGGANIALNPVVNLRVGAVVLKDCIRRGGSVADGLRLYVGAGTGDDAGYGARVLQEKDKLALAVRGARPKIEPIPAAAGPTTARIQARAKAQPDIDHSLDNVDPSDPKFDEHAKRVATL